MICLVNFDFSPLWAADRAVNERHAYTKPLERALGAKESVEMMGTGDGIFGAQRSSTRETYVYCALKDSCECHSSISVTRAC